MRNTLVLFTLMVGLFNLGGFLFGGGNMAHAACVAYFDPPPGNCESPCIGTYPRTTCTFGCISGLCNGQGNSSSCCGVIRFYAQITPDPNGPPCLNQECGLARIHMAERAKVRRHRDARNSLNANLQPSFWSSYQFPHILFQPNRCTHDYGVLVETEFTVPHKEGL
jgi:hypothetical protein